MKIQVFSTLPLSDTEKERIEKIFSQKVDVAADFDYQLDASLIGGLKVVLGSTVYDGSLTGRLEQVRKSLKA